MPQYYSPFQARISFQKLYRRINRAISPGQRRGLEAATALMASIFRDEYLSGPTFPKPLIGSAPGTLSPRSGQLRARTQPGAVKKVGAHYYFGRINFGKYYSTFHISKYPQHIHDLSYGTRIHTDSIIQKNMDKLETAFCRELNKVTRESD